MRYTIPIPRPDHTVTDDCESNLVVGLQWAHVELDTEPGMKRHYHVVFRVLWLDQGTGSRNMGDFSRCVKIAEDPPPPPRHLLDFFSAFNLISAAGVERFM